MNLIKEIKHHEQLEKDIAAIITTLKEGGPSMLTKTVKMMASGHFDLTALGLPVDLIETLEEYRRSGARLRRACELVTTLAIEKTEKDDVKSIRE
ncbi:hypothetical protein [Vibrio coralliilyticus]|uniref:hypothetical protein n=1 Tax=Vibrio coralliilyticus TaxID=190893 RepID=UPI00181D8BAD|nr:hypothetical protein [Vibrio coralliilyticus]NUW69562.1 hypothetical protein [Vibrio coralliilyticus]